MHNNKGFTLIELLMVMGIIAILATLIIPNLLSARGKAQEATARSEIAAMATALTVYETDRGSYPSSVAEDSSATLVYYLQGDDTVGWGASLGLPAEAPPPPSKQYFSFKALRINGDKHNYNSPLGLPYYYREYYTAGQKEDGKFDQATAREKVYNRDGFDIWTAGQKTDLKNQTNPEILHTKDNAIIKICNWD